MKKKHILLVTGYYPPEICSASHLMLELAEELKNRGCQITVLTCWPQYNLDNTIQNEYQECMYESEIRIIRVKHLQHNKVPFIIRGISQLFLPYLFVRKIKQYVKESIDNVIVYTPPLPLFFVGKWVKKNYKAKFILNVQDLFPQNAIDLGILKNPLLIRLFKYMEKNSYQNADVITVHSEGNKKQLLDRFPLIKNKLMVLHNWVDIDAHQVKDHQKNFRQIYQLEDKFIFLFAGVMGPSQNLELLLHAAEYVKEYNEICFLIVGDGSEKEKLQALCAKKKLKNIVFKSFINRKDYPWLLNSCDVGVISLSSKNKTPVVPGKMLGYMASKLPVIAFLNKESDGHKIISDAECGKSVVSDNLDNMVSAILSFYNNKNFLDQYGENGFHYAQQHFTKEICVDLLVEYF